MNGRQVNKQKRYYRDIWKWQWNAQSLKEAARKQVEKLQPEMKKADCEAYYFCLLK